MSNSAKPAKDEIIGLEKSFWDAMKKKDGARCRTLWQDQFGNRRPRRHEYPKKQDGKNDGRWTLESYSFDNVEVSTPAPDVAIIAYTVRQQITMDGRPQEMHAADNSTWIHGSNGWECHAHSETILKH